MKLKDATPWKESYNQPRQHTKKQRHYFVNKGLSSQGYGVSSGHVWMWELDYKESWVPKNWCFWTVVLEKTFESPLDCKEIQPVHPKGNQSWIFIERTDAEAETPILWPSDGKRWLIWKDPKRLRARGEGDDRGWDGWLASLTQWTWVWVGSESWWWTRRPGALQFMGSQRVGHDWATELISVTHNVQIYLRISPFHDKMYPKSLSHNSHRFSFSLYNSISLLLLSSSNKFRHLLVKISHYSCAVSTIAPILLARKQFGIIN